MVTYYNEKDIISFGNYVLSDERKQNKINSRDEAIKQGGSPLSIEEMLEQVSHADIENWKFNESLKKSKNFLKTLGVDMNKVLFCTEPQFYLNNVTGQILQDADQASVKFIQVSAWRNLSTTRVKELCDTHAWCIFYITDDSRLMTNEMGIIENIRCAFIDGHVNKAQIMLHADFIYAFQTNPFDDKPIQTLINEYCTVMGYKRYNNEFEIIAEGTMMPKVEFRIHETKQ